MHISKLVLVLKSIKSMKFTQFLKYPDLKPTYTDTQSVFREKNVN